MKIHIGCSGWQYREWRGLFYPDKLAQQHWFQYYTQHFNTVEINNTFYRYPKPETMVKWREQAPAGFLYSLKAPRFITHLGKFVETERQIAEFYHLADILEDKLGCLLFQLPGSFKYHPEALQRIVAQINPAYRNIIEFRDSSWWRNDVYEALRTVNIGFCHVSAPAALPQSLVPGAQFYLRLHGTRQWFLGSHSLTELQSWINKFQASGAEQAWIYFNNTMAEDAISDAKRLQQWIYSKLYKKAPVSKA